MRVNSEVGCPGCKYKTKVGFKAPPLLEPTIIKFNCMICESILLVKFSKIRGENWKVKTDIKIAASRKLLEMLKEEAEHNALPIEAEVNVE